MNEIRPYSRGSMRMVAVVAWALFTVISAPAIAQQSAQSDDPVAVAAQIQAEFERDKAEREARKKRDAERELEQKKQQAAALQAEALRRHEEAKIRAARAAGPVTLTQFARIQEWMSYAEVVDVLGKEGVELSRNYFAGYDTVMYQWVNRDGSNMNAMFQNDRLIQKAQFGLR